MENGERCSPALSTGAMHQRKALCPLGMHEVPETRGRYIVAIPPEIQSCWLQYQSSIYAARVSLGSLSGERGLDSGDTALPYLLSISDGRWGFQNIRDAVATPAALSISSSKQCSRAFRSIRRLRLETVRRSARQSSVPATARSVSSEARGDEITVR
jgi:hypothetical protein